LKVQNDSLAASLRSVASTAAVRVHNALSRSFALRIVAKAEVVFDFRDCVGEQELDSLVAPLFRGLGVRLFRPRDELLAEFLARELERGVATSLFRGNRNLFVFINIFLLRFSERIAHVFDCTIGTRALRTVVQHVRELVTLRTQ
jgi:hypothetical protein